MARKAKGKRNSLKNKKDATLKKMRLSFQLVSAELIEAEIILDDCIYEFNERFETGRRREIVEPEIIEESDSTDIIPSEAVFEEENEEEEEQEEEQLPDEEVETETKTLRIYLKK